MNRGNFISNSLFALEAICLVFILTTISGCMSAPSQSGSEVQSETNSANDPFESWNRRTYDFNVTVDKAVLKPVAQGYHDYIPEFVRIHVHDFLLNLRSPVIFANDVLQADPDKAYATFGRFLINTSVGVGGLFDVAAKDIPRHDNDLGITMGIWGVDEGPYLVLPLLGPSNPRDGISMAVEGYADPLSRYTENIGYWYIPLIRTAISGVDRRSDNLNAMDEIERTSVDPYSAIRSLYRQYRRSLIAGKPTSDKPRPGYGGDYPVSADVSFIGQ